MFMPVYVFSDEDELHHPDTLKIPESHEHRTACDVIDLATIDLLGPGCKVFRDMNWYPGDNRPDRQSPESWARRPIGVMPGTTQEERARDETSVVGCLRARR